VYIRWAKLLSRGAVRTVNCVSICRLRASQYRTLPSAPPDAITLEVQQTAVTCRESILGVNNALFLAQCEGAGGLFQAPAGLFQGPLGTCVLRMFRRERG
jgi:hypothetical protein